MKKRLIFSLLACMLLSITHSQKVDLNLLKNMKPRAIGPAGMSGRVTCIDVVQNDPAHIYIGTASGGVWESKSGGISWEPIFDDAPVQSIGSIAINQQNPAEIWVGTGEGNPRNSHNAGMGIFKSIDGGKKWKQVGLKNTKLLHRIYINPQNTDIVYVAALGSAWGTNPERGVFKTIDGGKSWKKMLYINDGVGCADLVMDPSNPNKLIAAMWEYGRKPWTFTSGGKNSGLHLSYDGGESWQKLSHTEGLPKGELGRIGLAIAPSKPEIIYALIEAKKNGLYVSRNGGKKWSLVSEKNIGNRPFYYADIFVDPSNENRIYNLHSTVTLSEDGGKTFKTLLGWGGPNSVHPDHHAFWVHPDDPNYLIEGNDGGLNISHDRGENWRFVENLPLAQFYHINYDMETPYNVYGGMQDNGSWAGPSSIWKRGGIRNADWREVMFGDGFDVVPRPDNSRYGYAMWQGGNLGYYDRETGRNLTIKPIHPDGEFLRFNWNAAIAQNPFHNCGIYYGSQYVHKSLDCGKTWTIISPDLTSNDTTKQKQAQSGGLTIDATQAENHTSLLCISPSPVDEQVIWAGSDDGLLHITKDGGENWSSVGSRMPGFPKNGWISQIIVSENNAAEAWIAANNYRNNDWSSFAYHTKDYGASWKRIVKDAQVDGHVISLAVDKEEQDLIFLGTDYGLYISFDAGNNWNKWMNGYPSVSTRDIKIHPREDDLILGTFGRACYILDNIAALRQLAKEGSSLLDEKFIAFKPQPAYKASYRSVDGTRFAGDAHFFGQNKNGAARIPVWVHESNFTKKKKDKVDEGPKESKKKKGKKKRADKAKVQIFNSNGDTLKTYFAKLDTGYNVIIWNLRGKGVRLPSHSSPKKDAGDPDGLAVAPGQYKCVISYKDQRDSTQINVYADPRYKVSPKERAMLESLYGAYTEIADKASLGFERLKEVEQKIAAMNKHYEAAEDSIKQKIMDAGKSIKKSIKKIKAEFMNEESFKGIDSVSPHLSRKFWATRSYIGASEGKDDTTARIALEQLSKATKDILKQINTILGEDWNNYKTLIDAHPVELIKKYEAIELN